MTDWDIEAGEQFKRVAIHEKYGGRRQGGIGPSRVTSNVLLFTDPVKGHKHGYFDGWGDDGCYHYAGEGQVGDQKMTQGNLAILNHERDGRALRLFRGVSSGVCQYLGQFTLPVASPWYLTDAPETGDGPIRSVIMFRLQPIAAAPREGCSCRTRRRLNCEWTKLMLNSSTRSEPSSIRLGSRMRPSAERRHSHSPTRSISDC